MQPQSWPDDQPTSALFDPATGVPTESWQARPAEPGEQPWQPFEQPAWYGESADEPGPPPRAGATAEPPSGTDFMGVSSWQPENAPPGGQDRRRTWILGSLTAAAVVVLLVAVAFIIIRSQDTAIAIPDPPQPPATTSTVSTSEPTSETSSTASANPPPLPGTTELPATSVVETVTSSDVVSSESVPSDTAPSETASTEAPPDPMGGPHEPIACSTGYIVQIASGLDEPSFQMRVAVLRDAGQLPAGAKYATTSESCAIFANQTNSYVLYAGPFASAFDSCADRLAGAPDSFIKGTTPETASEYVSCLCPTSVTSVPAITTIGQQGVWVGELQRVLARKLNLPISDLAANWGTFTQPTSDAVKQFQTNNGLEPNGYVDISTWEKLQSAQC